MASDEELSGEIEPALEEEPIAVPEDLIAKRYRRLAHIGSGGMGIVWKAKDEVLGREVALKELAGRTALSLSGTGVDVAARRAIREARIAARLHHPNVIGVYDFVQHEGRPWLVMEYLASRSLADLLSRSRTLPVNEVARIGALLAAALTAAHDAEIVHRDVKPANVLLAEDGAVKLTDFGISRVTGDTTVTNTGIVLGTVSYIAPEVALGQTADARSDVYSLGATLYAAAEGQPPFGVDSNAIALLYRIAHEEIIPARLAGPLGPVLMWMLDRDPKQRPTTLQVQHVLEGIANSYLAEPVVDDEEDEYDYIAPVEEPTPAAPPAVPAVAAAAVAEAAVEEAEVAAEPAVDLQAEAAPEEKVETGAKAEAAAEVAAKPAVGAEAQAGAEAEASTTPEPPAAPTPIPAADKTPRKSSSRATTPVLAGSPGPTVSYNPSVPSGSSDSSGVAQSRRRYALIAGIVAALVLIAGTILLVTNNSGGNTAAAGSLQTSASQRPTPSHSTTAAQPSATPSSSPTTAEAAATTAAATSAPPDIATQLTDTIIDYYQLMPSNTAAGWNWMTPDYQQNHAGGRANYDSFWAAVRSVSISDVQATLPSTVVATIHYDNKDGSTVVERTSFGLVQEQGSWKIASSSVLSHQGG
jgi:eukaryotic-like serine/threonine-protein kinase